MQRDKRWLAISYFHKGLISDDLLKQLQAFKQAVDLAPNHPGSLTNLARCYFRLAQREQSAEKRTSFAQKSLQYIRRYIASPYTFSVSRDKHYALLKQLKTEFPDLEIPELDSGLQ